MPFESGHQKIGGRKKGTPNKTTAILRDNLMQAFHQVGGVDYLVEVAKTDPKTFCSLLGRLLPAELKSDTNENQPVKIMVNTGINNCPPVGIDKANNKLFG